MTKLLHPQAAYKHLNSTLAPQVSLSPPCIDVGNPRVHVTPVFMNGVSEFCGRVPVSGVSRLKLQHYASAYNVTLVPSVLMPKKWHSKIQVCFHGNSSVGLCQCEKDDWRSLQDGFWSSFMSPYERKYVDVKFGDKVTGSVTVGVDEDFIPASSDYVPASPGKTYSSSFNSFRIVPLASPTLSLFHDDPYMKVLQAFYTEKSPIPPPTIIPPSSMPKP
ncbi:hypothetical protein Tco_0190506 [Tanacetum coccineum]